MAFGKGVPDLPYGQDRTTQDMADTYYGISEALAPQLLPGYLQREPVNALDPYAHSGIDEPWEMIHDAPAPPELDGRGYSNMQLGDKIAPFVTLAMMLAGARGMRGPQTNPTVSLRAPANTDLIKSTQAPGWMRPVVDEARLGAYAKDPLRHGAANLYAPTHGQITSPWRASELEQQMLRAQFGASPVHRPMVAMNEYNMLDDLPMVDVPRTLSLARASNQVHADQMKAMLAANRGQMYDAKFAPEAFPIIPPPAYAPTSRAGTAALAGELAAGFDQPSLYDRVLDSGLLGLLPYRDEDTPHEKVEDSDTNWREVWNNMLRGGKAGAAGIGSGAISAAKAGGADLGIGDLAQWLWSQTAGKGY